MRSSSNPSDLHRQFSGRRVHPISIVNRGFNIERKADTGNLSRIKAEQFSKQPIIESFVAKSEDGKWIIHKTTITDIKPVT